MIAQQRITRPLLRRFPRIGTSPPWIGDQGKRRSRVLMDNTEDTAVRVAHRTGVTLRRRINVERPGVQSQLVDGVVSDLVDVFPGALSLAFRSDLVQTDEDLRRATVKWQTLLLEADTAQFNSTMRDLVRHARSKGGPRTNELLRCMLTAWKYARRQSWRAQFPQRATKALAHFASCGHAIVQAAAISVLAALAEEPANAGRLQASNLVHSLTYGLKSVLRVDTTTVAAVPSALPRASTPASGASVGDGSRPSTAHLPAAAGAQPPLSESKVVVPSQATTGCAAELELHLSKVSQPEQVAVTMALLAQGRGEAVAKSSSGIGLLIRLACEPSSQDTAMRVLALLCRDVDGTTRCAAHLAANGGAQVFTSVAHDGTIQAKQCLASMFASFATVAPATLQHPCLFEDLAALQDWGAACEQGCEGPLIGGPAGQKLFNQHVATAFWAHAVSADPICLDPADYSHPEEGKQRVLAKMRPLLDMAAHRDVDVATGGLAALSHLMGDECAVRVALDHDIIATICGIMRSQPVDGRPAECALSCLQALASVGGHDVLLQVRCSLAN